jgi:hypothetical protein
MHQYLQLKPHAGALEPYLVDCSNMRSVRLKLLLRLGHLPLLDFVGHCLDWPEGSTLRACPLCEDETAMETPQHFVLECSALEPLRVEFWRRLRERLMEVAPAAWVGPWLAMVQHCPVTTRMQLLQGAPLRQLAANSAEPLRSALVPPGLPQQPVERAIDRCFRNFLMLAWKRRCEVNVQAAVSGREWTHRL